MTLTCWAKEPANKMAYWVPKSILIIIAPAIYEWEEIKTKFLSKPQAVTTMHQQHHYTPVAL